MAQKKPEPDNAMAGNVDQIREIIFGGHIREYEQRFADLEKSLKDSQAKLRKDFEAQLKALKQSLEETHGALEQEITDRRDADEGLDGLLQSQGGEIGKDLESAEARLAARADELSAALAAAEKSLSSELTKQGNALKRDLEQISSRLEDNKVARAELSKLLGGVADRLAGDTASKAKRK